MKAIIKLFDKKKRLLAECTTEGGHDIVAAVRMATGRISFEMSNKAHLEWDTAEVLVERELHGS